MNPEGSPYYGIVPTGRIKLRGGFKKRSRIVPNSLFQEFLLEQKLTLSPQRFPPRFDRWHYAQGFTQFMRARPSWVPDADFTKSMRWAHRRWFSLSPMLSLHEAVAQVITSCGSSFTTGKWMRFGATKREALINPECLDELERCIREHDFGYFSLSLKDEILAEGKTPRLFLPGDLALLVASYMCYGPLIDNLMTLPHLVTNYFLKDYPSEFASMFANLSKHENVRSADASGADTTMMSAIRRELYHARREFVDVPDAVSHSLLRAVEDALICPKVVDPRGGTYTIEGNPSGAFTTLLDNSFVFYVLHLYVWVRSGHRLEDFEKNVTLYVTGDDCIWSHSSGWYDDAFMHISSEMGFVFKEVEEGFGEVSYCQMAFSVQNGVAVQTRDYQRAVDALWYTFSDSYEATCCTVQSLLLLHWWSPARGLLLSFRSFLLKRSRGHPKFTWLTMPAIRTMLNPSRKIVRFFEQI